MARDLVERRDILRITGGSVFSGMLLGGQSASTSATTQNRSTLTDSHSTPPKRDEVEISNNDIRFIEADPDNGFHQPYLLYTPSSPVGDRDDAERSLVVEPNARLTDDFGVIIDSAVKNITSGIPGELTDQMDTHLLYPLFPETNHSGYVKVLEALSR